MSFKMTSETETTIYYDVEHTCINDGSKRTVHATSSPDSLGQEPGELRWGRQTNFCSNCGEALPKHVNELKQQEVPA